jgi:hypothetical protein
VQTPEQVEGLRNYLAENGERLGIVKLKDQFAEPTNTGFRALNTQMRLPNGHVAELRVEHEGVERAAKLTHKPYERVQEIERAAEAEGRFLTEAEALERQTILDDVRDIHGTPAREAGLDALLNENGRAKIARFEAERVSAPGGAAVSKAALAAEPDPRALQQVSDLVMKYSMDKAAGKPGLASPEEFAQRMQGQLERAGYPQYEGDDPLRKGSVPDGAPREHMILNAGLEQIKSTGNLGGDVGTHIRGIAETGKLPEIQKAPVNNPVQSIAAEDVAAFREKMAVTPEATVQAGDAGSIKVSAQDIVPERPGALLKAADAISDFGKRGGVIGGTVMGTVAGGITFAATGSSEDAAKMAVATAVPMGETITNVATGADAKTTIRTAKIEAASEVGSLGGAVAGAAAGAAVGSVVPIIGTAIGGIAGGLIGAFAGGYGGAAAAEAVLKEDFNEAASKGAPETKISLDAEELRGQLQNVSPEQAEKLSPETQSLYAFKDAPDKFGEQLAELQGSEGLAHVKEDMPALEKIAAEKAAQADTVPPEQKAALSQGLSTPTMA